MSAISGWPALPYQQWLETRGPALGCQDRRSRGAHVLGRVFTGAVANARPEVNREGMRTTLARLKRELDTA
jgi:hypothetical protein